MIYAVQNFWHNFRKSLDADDSVLLTDIMADECAKLIVHDRGKLIQALKAGNCKKPLGEKTTDDELVDILVNSKDEPMIRRKVAEVIMLNNSGTDEYKAALYADGQQAKPLTHDDMPENKKLLAITNALREVMVKSNQSLLRKKVHAHNILKKGDFSVTAESNLTEKEKRKVVRKTLLVTTGILAGTALITWGVITIVKKYRGNDIEEVEEVEEEIEIPEGEE